MQAAKSDIWALTQDVLEQMWNGKGEAEKFGNERKNCIFSYSQEANLHEVSDTTGHQRMELSQTQFNIQLRPHSCSDF